MAKPYTVKLKGGGSITVNASDENAAIENANQQTGGQASGEVQAGGHQTTSDSSGNTVWNPNAYVGAGEAGRAPNALQGGGATNPGAPAATPMAAGVGTQKGTTGTIGATLGKNMSTSDYNTWSNTSANTAPANGQVGNPNEYEYGMRPDDTFTSWAKRAFMEGTKDFAPGTMNPFISENGAAQNPYQQWFQSRYGTSAGINQLVASVLGGGDFTAGGNGWKDKFQGMMQSGNFNPTSSGEAAGNLGNLRNMVNGSHTGPDAGRNAMLDALQQDPSLANQAVLSQYSNVGGPLMGYLAKRLNNESSRYIGNAGLSQGSYWDLIMKMLGQ